MTIFERPARVRGGATSKSAAFADIPVKTEAQLLQAITTIESRGVVGGAIRIEASIAPSKTWSIPAGCAGLTIYQTARFFLTPQVLVIESLFDVSANFVSILDLLVHGTLAGGPGLAAFVRSLAGTAPRVENNDVLGCNEIWRDSSSGAADGAIIRGNRQRQHPTSFAQSIFVDSRRCLVQDNTTEDGGDAGIRLGPNAELARISDNDCGGADIDTSLSLGSNRLSANVNVGTKTLHTSDVDDDTNTRAQSSGTSLARRELLNFKGGLVAVDNVTKTDVDVLGGAGALSWARHFGVMGG